MAVRSPGAADPSRWAPTMIRGAAERLWYVRYLFRRGAWRWVIDSIDHTVMDHVGPWSNIKLGTNVYIHPSVSFRHADKITIGSHTRLQNACCLWASPNARIVVGDDSGLGPGTCVFSSNHRFAPGTLYSEQPWTERDVVIGHNVWVGAGSIVLPGVTISDDVVVAAGSVVTRSAPQGSVIAGVPARVIRTSARNPELTSRPSDPTEGR